MVSHIVIKIVLNNTPFLPLSVSKLHTYTRFVAELLLVHYNHIVQLQITVVLETTCLEIQMLQVS